MADSEPSPERTARDSAERDVRDERDERDEVAVAKFVENLGLVLNQLGMPRMPARVFAALSTADSGTMNAAELANTLSVSPAAVSGAVRYLAQTGLVAKEREPGARRDHYRLYDDFWYAAMLQRGSFLELWRDATLEGVDALGPNTPAGQRQGYMADFIDYLLEELPKLFARWHQRRTAADAE